MTTKSDSQITRRGFCNRVLFSSAGLVISASAAASQNNQERTLLVYPPAKIEGAERVMPGGYLYFDYPAHNPAVLLRTKEGQYLAYSRKCAHRGCSIDFDPSQRCLTCPCHRGVYDGRTGYVLYGPPPRPLDQIVLEIRAGGEVWAMGKRVGGDFNA